MIHRKFICLLVFVFQLTGESTFSQEVLEKRKFKIYDLEAKSIYKIDLENQNFSKINQEGSIGPIKLNFENVKLEDIDQNILINSFKKSEGVFYVSVMGTGQMYLFDINNRVFRRLDKTFYRGYNFFSIPFIRNDTIHSFGGSGFWHINNVPTFYNHTSKEWELLPQMNLEKGPARITSRFGGYHYLEDKLFSAEVKAPYADRGQLPFSFFQFDFKDKRWSKLGTVKYLPPSFMQFDHLSVCWTGQFFFSNNFSAPHFIDPVNNIIYKYNGKDQLFFDGTENMISKGSYLYLFLSNSVKDKVLVDSIHINTLLKDSIVMGSFYEPVTILDHINYYLVGIILLIIVLFFQFWEIRKYKISLSFSNRLLKVKELPEFSLEFLRFISNQESLICTTEELNKILNCSDKSIENQRQIRSKFISMLNLWIESEFHVTEAVARISSDYDKRFVNYTISPQCLIVLDQILKAK
jgi:hypothetical protein